MKSVKKVGHDRMERRRVGAFRWERYRIHKVRQEIDRDGNVQSEVPFEQERIVISLGGQSIWMSPIQVRDLAAVIDQRADSESTDGEEESSHPADPSPVVQRGSLRVHRIIEHLKSQRGFVFEEYNWDLDSVDEVVADENSRLSEGDSLTRSELDILRAELRGLALGAQTAEVVRMVEHGEECWPSVVQIEAVRRGSQ